MPGAAGHEGNISGGGVTANDPQSAAEQPMNVRVKDAEDINACERVRVRVQYCVCVCDEACG